MKKALFFIISIICTTLGICSVYAMQTKFSKALLTCENFSQTGSIERNNEVFNILVTLEKTKNGKCIYKEKIYQGKEYQMLTCNFNEGQLPFMSKSMEKYSEIFKKQLAKNPIFEAKMTTNGEIFQKYLANPEYCSITHSKK